MRNPKYILGVVENTKKQDKATTRANCIKDHCEPHKIKVRMQFQESQLISASSETKTIIIEASCSMRFRLCMANRHSRINVNESHTKV